MVDPNFLDAWTRFRQQRDSARYRGIIWRIPFAEWLHIWQDSGHFNIHAAEPWGERGTCKGQWVMSRPGDTGPYAAGNVRIVRTEANSSEGQRSPARRKAFLVRLRNKRADKARLEAIWRKVEAKRRAAA